MLLETYEYTKLLFRNQDQLCSFSFLSTLITATLTHHLGWITTVAPYRVCKSKLDRAGLKCCTSARDNCNRCSQNALWAQLVDLYGLNGFPIKLCKTIVSCSDSNVLNEIVTVLTYFIRSNKIRKAFYEPIFESGLLDVIMNYVSDNGDCCTSNVCSFYDKQLNTDCASEYNTDQIVDKSENFLTVNSGLCEPRCGLRSKDSLFNLRICSSLHDQTWQYINSKQAQNENNSFSCSDNQNPSIDSNSFGNQNYTYLGLSKNQSRTILYYLTSNKNAAQEYVKRKLSDSLSSSKNAFETNFQSIVTSRNAGKCDNIKKRNSDQSQDIYKNKGLTRMTNEKYPNLSALITKNSLGYTSLPSDFDSTDNDDENKVQFILGDNENIKKNLTAFNKYDDKIIPQVDREFLCAKNNIGDDNDQVNQEKCAGNKFDESIENVRFDEKIFSSFSHDKAESNSIGDSGLISIPPSPCYVPLFEMQSNDNVETRKDIDARLFKKLIILPLLK